MKYVIGHEATREKLSLLVSGDPSGTFLFYGPPSTGKRTVAFELSKAILCKNKIGDDCTCCSCKKFNLNHPDFFCIGWREKIRAADVDQLLNFCVLTPFLSDRKVVVIDNADEITSEAADKLLKILEEPPPKFTFFLITSNIQVLVPTVLYRCIKYEFGSLSKDELNRIIIEKLGFDRNQARVLSSIASSSSADFFSKAGLYIKYRDMACSFMLNLKSKSLIDLLDYINSINYSDIGIFLDMVQLVLMDVFLAQKGINGIVNEDKIKEISKISKMLSDKILIGFANIFSQIKKNSYLNIDMSMAIKNALIKLYPFIVAENKK